MTTRVESVCTCGHTAFRHRQDVAECLYTNDDWSIRECSCNHFEEALTPAT